MTSDQILEILYNNDWFIATNKKFTKTIKINGKDTEVPVSYYHQMENGEYTILIRVSNHCTYLETWVRPKQFPEQSLQNLSIVLTDVPCTYDKRTKPVKIKDVNTYIYFVVEQYTYKLENLSKGDFEKIIKRLKRLETEQIVFTDPLKKKPSKRAKRDVLTPDDKDGNPISPSSNQVHPRQTIVANNKDNEVDFDGNILEKNILYESIMKDISTIILKHLNNFHI